MPTVAVSVRPAELAELERRMELLPVKVQNTVMLYSAGKAMEPMKDAAKANVPFRRGVLRRAIGMKKCRYQEGRIVDVLVGVRKDVRTDKDWPVKYAHLVEFGTAPHRYKKPHAVKMELGAFSGWIWVTQHPGSKPQPFLRPAFDMTKATVAQDFHDRVLRGVGAVVDGFGLM